MPFLPSCVRYFNRADAFADVDKKYRIHPKDKNTVKKYQK
jgi:hypothetical protein